MYAFIFFAFVVVVEANQGPGSNLSQLIFHTTPLRAPFSQSTARSRFNFSTDAFLKHSITRLVSFRHDGLHIPIRLALSDTPGYFFSLFWVTLGHPLVNPLFFAVTCRT